MRTSYRPLVEPQVQSSDCGFVCISAVLAIFGCPLQVSEIKERVGQTSRGLTLKQVRDAVRTLGCEAEAVRFDPKDGLAYPTPSIVLLSRGHYVVARQRRGRSIETFDPQLGWGWREIRRFAKLTDGFAVRIAPGAVKTVVGPAGNAARDVVATTSRYVQRYLTALGVVGILFACLSQLVALALPLLSKVSIDALASNGGMNGIGLVASGFVLISATTALLNFVGNSIWFQLGRKVVRALGRSTYNHFAMKSPTWFDVHRPAHVQNKISAIEYQNVFAGDLLRSVGGLLIGLVAGVVVLFYISPWLALPGFVSLILSTIIELAFNRAESEGAGARLEAAQRRQAFVIETLAFLPILARFGSLKQGRHKFAMLTARAADTDAKLSSLRSWRALLLSTIKSCDTLIFVSLAALFMSRGEYTLGSFVAVGAYKDLLAQSLSSLFQMRQRHRLLAIQRSFAGDFRADETATYTRPRLVAEPRVELSDVSYGYGSLEPEVLRNVSLVVAPGDCLVIRGPSGSGKSTIAKLICGLALPTSGRVAVDGQAPLHPMAGFAAVLQSDRIFTGTIRDNVSVLRKGFSDEDVYAALRTAELEEFVKSLPMRLNTMVSEDGGGLSGGQRQRLLISRAALGNPLLILLDEATASLEVEIEAKILNNLKDAGATLILIAHRPEVWRFASQIVRIDDGALIADPLAPLPARERTPSDSALSMA